MLPPEELSELTVFQAAQEEQKRKMLDDEASHLGLSFRHPVGASRCET